MDSGSAVCFPHGFVGNPFTNVSLVPCFSSSFNTTTPARQTPPALSPSHSLALDLVALRDAANTSIHFCSIDTTVKIVSYRSALQDFYAQRQQSTWDVLTLAPRTSLWSRRHWHSFRPPRRSKPPLLLSEEGLPLLLRLLGGCSRRGDMSRVVPHEVFQCRLLSR